MVADMGQYIVADMAHAAAPTTSYILNRETFKHAQCGGYSCMHAQTAFGYGLDCLSV